MYQEIFRRLEHPRLYQRSGEKFWDDPHLSKSMLKAHLDPDYAGASRPLRFIEQSVAWVTERVPPQQYRHLLDAGCGPGLYAERFCSAGYQVTGIDYSKRSIAYAKTSARAQGLEIAYLYQNYLEMQFEATFEAAVLIYCDYGALSPEERAVLLRNLYRALKSGGKLLLDVFTMAKYDAFQEDNVWENCPNGGFWSAAGYLALHARRRYSACVTLEQIAVVLEEQVKSYNLWNSYFTPESLCEELRAVGFEAFELYGDVAGAPWAAECPTLAVLAQK